MVVHFDKDGNAIDTFYLSKPDGSLIQSTAMIVEPTRLLVGTATGGVYEFARPDKAITRPAKSAPATDTPKSAAQ